MVLKRKGADKRRDRLLDPAIFPTRAGFDRDDHPAAVGRGRANGTQRGLVRGRADRLASDVEYIASSENRSHGSALGAKPRRFCDGTRFRYVLCSPGRGARGREGLQENISPLDVARL